MQTCIGFHITYQYSLKCYAKNTLWPIWNALPLCEPPLCEPLSDKQYAFPWDIAENLATAFDRDSSSPQ